MIVTIDKPTPMLQAVNPMLDTTFKIKAKAVKLGKCPYFFYIKGSQLKLAGWVNIPIGMSIQVKPIMADKYYGIARWMVKIH